MAAACVSFFASLSYHDDDGMSSYAERNTMSGEIVILGEGSVTGVSDAKCVGLDCSFLSTCGKSRSTFTPCPTRQAGQGGSSAGRSSSARQTVHGDPSVNIVAERYMSDLVVIETECRATLLRSVGYAFRIYRNTSLSSPRRRP